MDGDLAPLAGICDLKDAHDALLLLDEAHAFGVLGPQGRGLAAALGLESRVDLQMGTFSKAAGPLRRLRLRLACDRRFAREPRPQFHLFDRSPPPPSPRRSATDSNSSAAPAGRNGAPSWHDRRDQFQPGAPSAIVPVILGDNETALSASAALQERGSRPPRSDIHRAAGLGELRVTLSAAHLPGTSMR